MKKLMLLISVLLWTGSASARPGDDHLAAAAYRLDHAANRFYGQLHYRRPYARRTELAGEFARQAKRFRRQVRRGNSRAKLHPEYARLNYRYERLLRGSGNVRYISYRRNAPRGMRQVNTAFSELRYLMRRPWVRNRGHQRDRQYYDDGKRKRRYRPAPNHS